LTSLRARYRWTVATLAALQLVAVAFGMVSWQRALDATAREQALADARSAVDALREMARESYVHEAHTFIEGGAAHLDHLHEVDERLDERLAMVAALPLPTDGAVALAAAQTAVVAARTQFADEVIPRALAGALDRPAAAEAHARAEALAGDVSAAIDAVASAIDGEQSRERVRIADATKRAWQVTALSTLGGVLLALAVARWLEGRVIDPLDHLRAAADRFGAGRADRRVDEQGDDEVAALGRAFNRMTAAVREAQAAQVRGERLQALGELSAAIAHELMNPLTVLLGHPAMNTPALAPARAEAEHARRVVHGLLAFARPGEEAPVVVDLGQAARDAAARVTGEADLREVSIAVTVVGAPSVTLPWGAVRHVLDNLVRNAVQASPSGGLVDIVVAEGAVEVADRGPGLPARIRARLYEPFQTTRADGTGLGLAVCQRIARGTGGAVQHEDRAGGGTVARWIPDAGGTGG
jgi:two-component system NtrC family sensor kinase